MVPCVAVGAVGVPVNVGEFKSAFEDMSSVPHEAVVPLVVRYFPELPVCEGRPSTEDVVTPVTKPLAFTVITGMAVDDPYVFAETPELASVTEIDVVPDPEASPEIVIDWLPVKYVLVSSVQESAPVLFKNPVPVSPEIAVRSASSGCFWESEVAMLDAKFASSPSAAANSSKVSRAPGALLIRLLIAVLTNPVVAIWVVLVPALAVGAAGIPVKVGEFMSALPEMSIVFHETTAPSVLRNLPEFPV